MRTEICARKRHTLGVVSSGYLYSSDDYRHGDLVDRGSFTGALASEPRLAERQVALISDGLGGFGGPLLFVVFYTWLYNRTGSVLLCVSGESEVRGTDDKRGEAESVEVVAKGDAPTLNAANPGTDRPALSSE